MNARKWLNPTNGLCLAVCLAAFLAAASPGWARKTVFLSVGRNSDGQLGLGGTDTSYAFRIIPSIETCESVRCGGWTSFALDDAGGLLYAAGNNFFGALGVGDTSDKTVFTAVPALAGFSAVAPGSFHTLALKGGDVWGAGWNDHGELGLGDTDQRNQLALVLSFGTVTAIAAGNRLSLALLDDGTVWGAGWNESGQLGLGDENETEVFLPATDIDDVDAIAAGHYHSLALRAGGTVWTTGRNTDGQLGLGDTSNRNVFTQAGGLDDVVVAIAGGASHSVALTEGGRVWVTGRNADGQLGLGDTVNRTVFTQVPDLTDVVAIAAGGDHSLALRDDGTLWGAGSNDEGGLGFGAKTDQVETFTMIPGVVGVRAMTSGYTFMFVRADYGVEATFPSDAGITFERGKKQVLTWDTLNLPPKSAVKVELVKGGTQTWLLSAAAKKVPLKWTVGKAIKGAEMYPDGDDYRIRVSTPEGDDLDVSDNDFAIGTVTALTIDGPTLVIGGSAAPQYTCTAHFNFGADQDVTSSVKWSVDPKTWAKMGKTGLLTTKLVTANEPCTLRATYGKGKPPVTGTLEISIDPGK